MHGSFLCICDIGYSTNMKAYGDISGIGKHIRYYANKDLSLIDYKKTVGSPRWRMFCACVLVAGVIVISVLTSDEDNQLYSQVTNLLQNGRENYRQNEENTTTVQYNESFAFNKNANDVIVNLDIQKPSGSNLEHYLTTKLQVRPKCKTWQDQQKKSVSLFRCNCKNNNGKTWLFSDCFGMNHRMNPCSLNSDYSFLSECVPAFLESQEGPTKRRYFYITMLQHPLQRFISEWSRARSGETLAPLNSTCNSPLAQMSPCYTTKTWMNVTLDEFMKCRSNIARNRQTWRLADLKAIGCMNLERMSISERESVVLRNAKENLQQMAFFGLTENMKESLQLFEKVFGMKFSNSLLSSKDTKATKLMQRYVTKQKYIAEISSINNLDIELYSFARQLFFQRNRDIRKKVL